MLTSLSPAFPKPARVTKPRKQLGRNRKRSAKRYADNFGERGAAVRAMPCVLAATGGCEGPTEAAHAKARGMGGVNSDRRSLVALCRHHHRQSHTMGCETFAARYRIDLGKEAERAAAELDARGLP